MRMIALTIVTLVGAGMLTAASWRLRAPLPGIVALVAAAVEVVGGAIAPAGLALVIVGVGLLGLGQLVWRALSDADQPKGS